MNARFLIFLLALLPTIPANADEPMMPPSVWETCSPSGEYCARLDPVENSILAYKPGVETIVLWRAEGWSSVAALADDGEHLVLGYEGMNLIPVDHEPDMEMLIFYRRGMVFQRIALSVLIDSAALQRTVSHWYWGDYLGLDANGHYAVHTADGKEFRFDMTTGLPVR
ncbi:MAG: hypothetical protein IMF08_02215 [Proteobacteria bacterium]|nr:hypothetical protein [Pseudomonadota bacterium]